MRRQLVLTLAVLSVATPAAGQSPVVYRIAVTGTVENGLAPYVARSLREAEAAGAAAAYLDIDTPGGRVDAAERISDAIRRVDRSGLRLRRIPAPSAPAPSSPSRPARSTCARAR